MKKYKLVDVETGEECHIDQASIDENTKFIMYLNVGSLPSGDVPKFLDRVKETVNDFFGKGKCLIIPRREKDTVVAEVKVE